MKKKIVLNGKFLGWVLMLFWMLFMTTLLYCDISPPSLWIISPELLRFASIFTTLMMGFWTAGRIERDK